jgi:hypothetical protein
MMSGLASARLAIAFFLTLSACAPLSALDFAEVQCEGDYPQHLQGVCSGGGSLFWSFTDRLVKTDEQGKVQKQTATKSHHGDPCYDDGKVYVAANFGAFNRSAGGADSWVYVYSADDLSPLAKHPAAEVIYGAGGIAHHAGRFLVIGGLPLGVDENYAYEYDGDFKFIKRHVLKSGQTLMGIQTAQFADGHWWLGCYGLPPVLLKADEPLEKVERFDFDASLGIVPVSPGKLLVARGAYTAGKGYSARLVPAQADDTRGLVIVEPAPSAP